MSPTLISLIYWGVVLIFLAFAVIVLLAIYKMDLSGLISELDKPPNGPPGGAPPPAGGPHTRKASLSRFQFLIFTFVVGGVYLALSIESGTFVEIPTNALYLMGISGGSFVLSKQISK